MKITILLPLHLRIFQVCRFFIVRIWCIFHRLVMALAKIICLIIKSVKHPWDCGLPQFVIMKAFFILLIRLFKREEKQNEITLLLGQRNRRDHGLLPYLLMEPMELIQVFFLMRMAPYGIRVILYLKIRCMKVIMVFTCLNLIRKHFSFRENEG